MLAGVMNEPTLCCEGNYSLERLDVLGETEDTIREELAYLEWAVYRIAVPIILTLGLFGNVLTLGALSFPSFHSIAYVYLFGLAIADTGALVFWMPIAIRLGYGINRYYLIALYHAHIELVAANAFMAASIFIMVCLTMDRYASVFFPGRLRTGNTRRNANLLITSSFVIAFTMSIPLGGMRIVYEMQSDTNVIFTLRENTAVTRTNVWKVYFWTLEILIHIGPSLTFVLLNGLVIKRFLQLTAKKRRFHVVSDKYRSNHIVEISSLTRNRGYREEQRLVILLTAIIVLFFVTTIPSACISSLYPKRWELDIDYQKFRTFANVAELSNFVLHCFVHLLCSVQFRGAIFRILRIRCKEEVRNISQEPPVGEIEDFSRHGTTFRLSPEHTKLHSPVSPSKNNVAEEDTGETQTSR